MPISPVCHIVLIIEGELRLFGVLVGRMLCDDVPEGAEEVTEDEDEEDETEDAEDVHEVDLLHNLVVIILHRLQRWVILNTVI